MTIKCSECGDGIMKKGTISDDNPSWYGYDIFRKRMHRGSKLKVGDEEFQFGNLHHLEDEIIVICSNYPRCNNQYVMKEDNFNGRNLDRKVEAKKIKGYGTYHYNK